MNNQISISLLRLHQVQVATGLPRSSIYALIKQGAFPRPVPIGARTVAWSSLAVQQWITDRVNQAAVAQTLGSEQHGERT